MSIAHEDKRIVSRRQEIRRMYDMLRGLIEEEERRQHDKLLLSRHLLRENRREQERRSGRDRRVDD